VRRGRKEGLTQTLAGLMAHRLLGGLESHQLEVPDLPLELCCFGTALIGCASLEQLPDATLESLCAGQTTSFSQCQDLVKVYSHACAVHLGRTAAMDTILLHRSWLDKAEPQDS